jgi:hypothetical protein
MVGMGLDVVGTLNMKVGLRVLTLFTIELPTTSNPIPTITQHLDEFDHSPTWLTPPAVQLIIQASQTLISPNDSPDFSSLMIDS